MYVLHFKLGYSKNIFLVGRISVGGYLLDASGVWRKGRNRNFVGTGDHIWLRGLPNYSRNFQIQQTWVDQ